jgi:adenylosuccinate synthase
MARQIIVLSGPIGSGKTTLASSLVKAFAVHNVKTRDLIQKLRPRTEQERGAFQDAGERLDRATHGAWLSKAVARIVQELPGDAVIVIDAARIEAQLNALRDAFPSHVVHVHLTAPPQTLARRYQKRKPVYRELASYAEAKKNVTENAVERLQAVADLVIDTAKSSPDDVLARVASQLGFYGRSYRRLVDVLIGGQYGSEGKGHIASYLSSEYNVLVRVGGPNAGHTVFEAPTPYTFHHLPSGTRASEASLVLGPGMVINVQGLLREIAECGVSAMRLAIDPQAVIIEPSDIQFEQRSLAKSIGSTAQGVGRATARRVLRGAGGRVKLAKDVSELRPFIRSTRDVLDRAFFKGSRVLVEGTQGTGLSLYHGSYPHVTSRDTTVGGCLAEAGIAPSRVRKIVMVCRTYPIRVEDPADSTSGPMTTELTWAEVSRRSGIPVTELRQRERTSTTKRRRRVAEFDWALLRRAASLNGPTDIALTFADYISVLNRSARRFEQLTSETIRFVEEVERVAAAPVSLITTRFHSRSIIDRRAW